MGRLVAVATFGLALAGGSPQAQTKTVLDNLPSFDVPASLSGSYLAGRYAGSVRDIENAATYFRDALQSDPTNQVLIERAFPLLLADGRIREALPLAEKILLRDKGNQIAHLVLGVDLLKRNQFDRARAQFAAMAPRPLTDLTAAVMTGWTYAGQNDPDASLRVIDKLGGPEWYVVFKGYHTALIADLTGRKVEAQRRMAIAYKADTSALRVADAEARMLAKAGKTDEALALLADFEKIVPDHPLIAESRAAITAGKLPATLVPSPQAGSAELLYGLGAAIGRDGGEEVAAIYLQLALWLDPKAELPLISLASLQGQLKQHQKAIDFLDRIPVDSPLKGMADIQVGRYFSVLQKYDEARSRLEAIVAKTPKDIDAVMALADVLRANKNFAEAAEVYTKAIDLIPKPQKTDWSLYYYRGISYERTKQWPKAEADFFKALELSPNEPHVLNYLGYSWIDMGQNLDKGLGLVKQAVDLKPDDGYIVDSLGWAYFRLARYEDAVREMERAVLLKPEDPVINDHLGDAYWKVGRTLEATFQWAHSRDLKPEPDDLIRIEKKLKEGLKDDPIPVAAQTAPDAATPEAPKPQ